MPFPPEHIQRKPEHTLNTLDRRYDVALDDLQHLVTWSSRQLIAEKWNSQQSPRVLVREDITQVLDLCTNVAVDKLDRLVSWSAQRLAATSEELAVVVELLKALRLEHLPTAYHETVVRQERVVMRTRQVFTQLINIKQSITDYETTLTDYPHGAKTVVARLIHIRDVIGDYEDRLQLLKPTS